MYSIEQKLESWKNKLFDLSKRNRLINYKDTKRSTLQIITPEIFNLWESFVVNESPLEFPYVDEDEINTENDEVAEPIYSVITNQSIKDQQRTLRNLREKAKIAIAEQGVNILYLSFGFLKWSESKNSEQYLSSPIILVPVSLTIESITDPYILSLHEDEIIINPTLAYKLENDFGITLPEFNDEQSISEYFNAIRELVYKSKWEVLDNVSLSLLSFLKINMYDDLKNHTDRIKSHPIIRALCGDGSALKHDIENINDFDHDSKTKPVDVFQVVDADSSQQDAIMCAKKGVSFVLQGPPGTGKSQTITNIIAECIADGKKVLFVSEKMAALEVVHRRLSTVGLSDFCLTLHSHKANKKNVLEQLETVLNLARTKANLSDEVFQKLDLLQEHKEKLNKYVKVIFEKIVPLKKTIYQVNGKLANLQDYEDMIFIIPDVAKTTPTKFNKYINLLTEFENTIGKMSDDYKSNPWNSTNINHVSHELRHDVNANLTKIIPKIDVASKLYDEIDSSLNVGLSSSYNGLTELIEIFKLPPKPTIIPIHWIIGDDITPLFAEIDECSNLKKQFVSTKNTLTDLYKQVHTNDPKPFEGTANDIFTSKQIDEATASWNDFIDNNYCYTTWNKAENFGDITSLFTDAKENIAEFNSLKNEMLSVFEKEIFDIDYKEILSRFKTDYTSIFKIFKKQYKLDRNSIIGKYKDFVKKVQDTSIIATLTKLRRIEKLELWMTENSGLLSVNFGEYYKAENTVFEDIEKVLSAFRGIQGILKNLLELKTVVNTNEIKSNEFKLHYEYLYDDFNTDWDTILKALNWASDFRKTSEQYNFSEKFIHHICTNKEKIELCSTFVSKIEEAIRDIDVEFNWYLDLFDDKETLKNTKMPALYDRIEKCRKLSLLEEWIDFRTARENCYAEGLQDCIDKIMKMQIDVSFIIPIFEKRFYHLWLGAILPNYPAVMNFRRRTHESIIHEFARLDKLQFDIAKARIQKKFVDNLPQLERFTSGTDEIAILKRELQKKRKIMPLRKLFLAIPNNYHQQIFLLRLHLIMTMIPMKKMKMIVMHMNLFLMKHPYYCLNVPYFGITEADMSIL